MLFRTLAAFAVAVLLAASGSLTGVAVACPFCSAPSQTLRQEVTAMDVVAIGRLAAGQAETIDGQATFKIERVLQGDALAAAGQELAAPYFGSGKSTEVYLLMGVNSDGLLWSSPLTLSDSSVEYVTQLFKLPAETQPRLRFYAKYLQHPETLLANDAYAEFALAPYSDVVEIADSLDKDKLWSWLSDPGVSPDRKRLYYTLLGIVGGPEDVDRLSSLLSKDDPESRAGLDALIACYLNLVGQEGLPLVEEQFLVNKKASYADTYAAIMALRFHGTDGTKISQEEIVKSIRLMLDRPDYADLVIPDLARWEDWSQVETLVGLFKAADPSNNWIRQPVIRYLQVCPLPEAKVALDELKEIDPKAFQRAAIFQPLPISDGSDNPAAN